MRLNDLHRHLAGQTLQAFRALLAVVFGIDRQTNVLIQCIIQHQRAEVLDGIQRVAAAAMIGPISGPEISRRSWSHST